MSPFVRFIFILVSTGAAINLMIVLLSNSHNQKRQEAQWLDDQNRFLAIAKESQNLLRQAEIAVEWQKIDAHDRVLETSLIIRRPYNAELGSAHPPELSRVLIPGNRLHVDGIFLVFSSAMEGDFAPLKNLRLGYFREIFGEDEAGRPQHPENRFSFLNQPDIPRITRIDPDAEHPTFYETRLWTLLWQQIDQQQNNEAAPNAAPTPPAQVKILPMKDAVRTVSLHKAYLATLGLEGVTLDEETGQLDSILDDARKYLPPDNHGL